MKMYMHINQTPQRSWHILRSTISTISRRIRPPEGTWPCLPVKSQRQKSQDSPRIKRRKCPERTIQHPFSRKSKFSRRRQLYQDVKSHFSGKYYENWWIGVWVPEGRTWFWKRHKSARQQRGKKASQCQRILHIEHTPIDTSNYLWEYLPFISLLIEWKVSLGTCSWRPTFTTEEFERTHQQRG